MSRLREKTTATLLIAIFIISAMAFAIPVMAKKDKDYATIQDGTITDTKGNLITVGYDKWGYNYQAHLFNGWYWNSQRPEVPWTEETLIAAGKSTTWLVMKWNDAWLSNMDRDLDGKLDRHWGFESYRGSGAWCTNHQFGSYIDEYDGEEYKWNYFVKMVSAPDDAYTVYHEEDATWYYHLSDGTEMGTVIWTHHARILQIYNDQGTGEHGVLYNPAGPTGFGYYK